VLHLALQWGYHQGCVGDSVCQEQALNRGKGHYKNEQKLVEKLSHQVKPIPLLEEGLQGDQLLELIVLFYI
jgi:hypothetical protein